MSGMDVTVGAVFTALNCTMQESFAAKLGPLVTYVGVTAGFTTTPPEQKRKLISCPTVKPSMVSVVAGSSLDTSIIRYTVPPVSTCVRTPTPTHSSPSKTPIASPI